MPQVKTAYKIIFSLVAVLVGIAIAFPYILPLFYRKEQVMKLLLTVLVLSTALSVPTWAATTTVTLLLPGMTCATCPITVKKALNKVEGVENIEVTLVKKEAVVTFDDAKTTVEALLETTKNAGYPSTVHP